MAWSSAYLIEWLIMYTLIKSHNNVIIFFGYIIKSRIYFLIRINRYFTFIHKITFITRKYLPLLLCCIEHIPKYSPFDHFFCSIFSNPKCAWLTLTCAVWNSHWKTNFKNWILHLEFNVWNILIYDDFLTKRINNYAQVLSFFHNFFPLTHAEHQWHHYSFKWQEQRRL